MQLHHRQSPSTRAEDDAATPGRLAMRVIRDEHRSLAAMLRSLPPMLDRGPGDEPERFFDVVRAMLFYIDEFPERLHHPKESELLFPRVARHDPTLLGVIEQLESDHVQGEDRVRHLQHLLLAWELLGESRRAEFEDAARKYVQFYLEHMRVEETRILPVAERELSREELAELDAAFGTNADPLATGTADPRFDRLFTRIVMRAPSPIGLGPA
jgi:hemerythrin-like domain-containing protein